MMDMMKMYVAAAALLSTLAACNGSKHEPLEGTTWKLSTMAGIPASAIGADDDAFVVEFNAADMTVSGRTNCNRFFGHYELKGRELDFENMGMTRMACPDMQYEDMFVKMLDEADRYRIKDSELTLYDDKRVLAVFKAASKNASDRNDSHRRDSRSSGSNGSASDASGRTGERAVPGTTGTVGTGSSAAGTSATGTSATGAAGTGVTAPAASDVTASAAATTGAARNGVSGTAADASTDAPAANSSTAPASR